MFNYLIVSPEERACWERGRARDMARQELEENRRLAEMLPSHYALNSYGTIRVRDSDI